MKTKNLMMFALAIMLLITGSAFISAITGSIGNGKMVLYPEVNGWTNTLIEKTILVNNVNDVPVNITLKLDSESSEFIDLIDKSFILEAGESKKAEIVIRVRKEGTYEGRVNVFFKPVEGKEAGVVLSSTIVVIASKDTGYEEEEEQEENTEEQQTDLPVENPDDKNQPSKLIKFWGISTIVLVVVLLFLLYIWNKKRKKRKTKGKRKK